MGIITDINYFNELNELGYINRAQDNVLSINDFEKGKFLNMVGTEEGEINLTTRTKIAIAYISKSDRIDGLKIKKFVKKIGATSYEAEADQCIYLSTLTLQQLINLTNIIQNLNLLDLSNKKITLLFDDTTLINDETYNKLKSFFELPQIKSKIENGEIISNDLILSIEQSKRRKAIEEFENSLNNDMLEHHFQIWFESNSWIFGTDFIEILDDREIDKNHISDLLMKAYDGFVDIIEIKRPSGNLNFWNPKKDHENYVPHNDLIKAITQVHNYIFEIERESNSIKFQEDHSGISIVKPRAILIYGRSNDWNKEQIKAFRILNSSYHNLSILTYDHVLERAKTILGIKANEEDIGCPF